MKKAHFYVSNGFTDSVKPALVSSDHLSTIARLLRPHFFPLENGFSLKHVPVLKEHVLKEPVHNDHLPINTTSLSSLGGLYGQVSLYYCIWN